MLSTNKKYKMEKSKRKEPTSASLAKATNLMPMKKTGLKSRGKRYRRGTDSKLTKKMRMI